MSVYETYLSSALQSQIALFLLVGVKSGGKQGVSIMTAMMMIECNYPLRGLMVVLNAGNGSGGFFTRVLERLGADILSSIHWEPNGRFPVGVPNPECALMLQETIDACQRSQADLGIMLDTDADRCGFMLPTPATAAKDNASTSLSRHYEPLHRNRLIALMGVVCAESAPGCTVVTDSVTSNGLTTFLQDHLGLTHIRYIKGYANVIAKAKELNAETAIETSGHCAMKENAYIDDGPYTAVKIVSLLAAKHLAGGLASKNLLNAISIMEELDEIVEFRLPITASSTMSQVAVYDACLSLIEYICRAGSECDIRVKSFHPDLATAIYRWKLGKDNLDGIHVLPFGVGSEVDSGYSVDEAPFFLLRRSLHDPIIGIQMEGRNKEQVQRNMVQTLLRLFQLRQEEYVCLQQDLDVSALEDY